MAGDAGMALDDGHLPTAKPQRLTPLTVENPLAGLPATPSYASSMAVPGSLLTRMELATGETSPAATLIRFARHVQGGRTNSRRPNLHSRTSVWRRGKAGQGSASICASPKPYNLCASPSPMPPRGKSFAWDDRQASPVSDHRRGLVTPSPVWRNARASPGAVGEWVSQNNCRQLESSSYETQSMDEPMKCANLGFPSLGRRVPLVVKEQPRWVVTTPRWKVCPTRPSLSPSVRAYTLPDGAEAIAAEDEILSESTPANNSPHSRIDQDDAMSGASFDDAMDSRRSTPEDLQSLAHDIARHKKQTVVNTSLLMQGIPWTEDELKFVFKKFGDTQDQEVRTEDLPTLLRYLGARPKDDEISRIVKEQTQYASMDWPEFLEFIRRYRVLDVEGLRDMFNKADANGNGELDFSELHTLLVKAGYSPTVEATLEALQAIDEDGSGTVDLDEFERLREHLRVTRGFMRTEAEELFKLFVRVSGGPKERLPSDSVWRISSFIGFAASKEDVAQLVATIDRDASQTLSYDELLQVVRGVRDMETGRLGTLIARKSISLRAMQLGKHLKGETNRRTQKDSTHAEVLAAPTALSKKDKQGPTAEQRALARQSTGMTLRIPVEEIAMLLGDLGYFISEDLVDEILEDMDDELESADYITKEELIALLGNFRKREGFTVDETNDLKEIFEKEQRVSVAGDCDESLDALELGRVLRWFGISKSLQQVQRLIEEIDFDGSGQVEFDEFTKLMRQLLQAEARRRRDVFAFFAASRGVIRSNQLSPALTMILGTEPDEEMVHNARLISSCYGEDITLRKFEHIFAAYRAELQEKVRQNAGYIPSEVEQLRTLFGKYDRSNVGSVKGADLRRLIADNAPEATRTKESQQEMMRLLREVAPKDPSALNFLQFLWMTRRIQDQRDEMDILLEAEVLKKALFTSDEVEGYRALFSNTVSWKGELGLQALKMLLMRIHTFTQEDEEQLGFLVRELSPDGREVVRFPQFLQLMRMFSHENRLGVADSAQKAILREQASQKAILREQGSRTSFS